jgi:hypothetical protein
MIADDDHGILETLLVRRRWIPLIALLSVVVGFGVAHHGAGTRKGGYAQLKVLIGSANGQSSNLDGVSPQALSTKAPLMADQLGTASRSAEIARQAGIDPRLLAVRVPAFDAPKVGVPVALSATEVAAASSVPYVLRVGSAPILPLLTITGLAPDAASAARLVQAADAMLDRSVARSTPRHTSIRSRLLVQQLGTVQSRTIVTRSKPILAVVAGFLFFGFGCCALIAWTGIHRTRRRRARSSSPMALGAG